VKIPWSKPFLRWKETLGPYCYVLPLIAVGMCLLLLPAEGRAEDQVEEVISTQSDSFDLEAFEAKLEQILSRIQGAGETQVVLTLDGGSRQVLAQDLDRSETGDMTTSTVTVGRGSGSQEVVPLQTLAPSFRGALVVCPGGGDPQTQLKIAEAVSALTGLGTNRISICQGNT
jgi:stage III sporulation protein AG